MSIDERITELECTIGVFFVFRPEEDVYVVRDKVGLVGAFIVLRENDDAGCTNTTEEQDRVEEREQGEGSACRHDRVGI